MPPRRFKKCCNFACALFLPLASTAHAGDDQFCLTQVAELSLKKRHEEAAKYAQNCYATENDVRALWAAANAWRYAGFYAHAKIVLDEYMGLASAAGEPFDLQQRAEDLQREVLGATVELNVVLSQDAASDLSGHVTAEYQGSPSRPVLKFPVKLQVGSREVLRGRFDPGLWKILVRFDRHDPFELQQSFVLGKVPPSAVVDLNFARRNDELRKPSESPTREAPETVSLELHLGPAQIVRRGTKIHLSGPQILEHDLQVSQPIVRVPLPPGKWRIFAEAPGHYSEPAEFMLPMGVAFPPIELHLRRSPEARTRLGLGIGYSSLVLPLLSAGIALLATNERPSQRECVRITQDCAQLMAVNLTASSLVGAGLGLAIASVTSVAKEPRTFWWSEFGAGVGLMLIGVPLWADGWVHQREVLLPRHRETVSGASITAFGASLLASSLTAVLIHRFVERKNRRRR